MVVYAYGMVVGMVWYHHHSSFEWWLGLPCWSGGNTIHMYVIGSIFYADREPCTKPKNVVNILHTNNIPPRQKLSTTKFEPSFIPFYFTTLPSCASSSAILASNSATAGVLAAAAEISDAEAVPVSSVTQPSLAVATF